MCAGLMLMFGSSFLHVCNHIRKSIIFQVLTVIICVGMAILSRKNCLGKSLMAFRKKFPA